MCERKKSFYYYQQPGLGIWPSPILACIFNRDVQLLKYLAFYPPFLGSVWVPMYQLFECRIPSAHLERNAHMVYAAQPSPFQEPTSTEHLVPLPLLLPSFFFFHFSQSILNFQNAPSSTCSEPDGYRNKIVYSKVVVHIPLPGYIRIQGKSRRR